MYEELISRLKNLAMLTTENGKSAILVSNEAVQAIREIATEAENAIEELSKELMELKMLTCCCGEPPKEET